jgi:Flp pilus assembly protein TadG
MLRKFRLSQLGTTSVEFAIVTSAFLLILFGIVDFGRLFWVWNSAVQATERGARLAVVSDIVPSGLANFDCLVAANGNGALCPVTAVSPNPVICTVSGCNGYGPIDAAAFNKIVTEMQRYSDVVQPQNVQIEYRHIGLGFSGNPFGSDIAPLVTVKLQGLVFDFVVPGFSGLTSINMPEFKTTLTGEDNSG